jgi:hypothetical protein
VRTAAQAAVTRVALSQAGPGGGLRGRPWRSSSRRGSRREPRPSRMSTSRSLTFRSRCSKKVNPCGGQPRQCAASKMTRSAPSTISFGTSTSRSEPSLQSCWTRQPSAAARGEQGAPSIHAAFVTSPRGLAGTCGKSVPPCPPVGASSADERSHDDLPPVPADGRRSCGAGRRAAKPHSCPRPHGGSGRRWLRP